MGKTVSVKPVGKTVSISMNIFVYMKVFICFPLVPSSGKCFSATFPILSFLFKSHISPPHSCTTGSKILIYSLPTLSFIKYSAFSRNYSALGNRVQVL